MAIWPKGGGAESGEDLRQYERVFAHESARPEIRNIDPGYKYEGGEKGSGHRISSRRKNEGTQSGGGNQRPLPRSGA